MYIQNVDSVKCKHCQGSLRLVKPDGSLIYYNGDQLPARASRNSKCGCGYKHFWDGKEYDNIPQKIAVVLEWTGLTKNDFVYWFQHESNDALNSNAFELAQKVVQKHFPGEFGSERLVQRVVEQIFSIVIQYEPQEKQQATSAHLDNAFITPTKIILTGPKSKSIHKEELIASKSEHILRKKIEHGAVMKQKRLTSSPIKHSLQNVESSQKATEIDVPRAKVKPQSKIRICAEDQGNEMFALSDTTTFDDIKSFIEEKFDIKKDLQIIKYGFPPKVLEGPIEEDKPVMLKHGEKLTVHKKKMQKVEVENKIGMYMETVSSEADLNVGTVGADMVNSLTSSLFSLIENVDLWDWACTQRRMFQPDGIFYKQAFKDLDHLRDNQHFSLPCFPAKLFSYNLKENEIFLCLGETHIHVQVLSSEQLTVANQQNKPNTNATMHPPQEQIYYGESPGMSASSSTTNTSNKSNVVAFSGTGHSMVDTAHKNAHMFTCESEDMDQTPTDTFDKQTDIVTEVFQSPAVSTGNTVNMNEDDLAENQERRISFEWMHQSSSEYMTVSAGNSSEVIHQSLMIAKSDSNEAMEQVSTESEQFCESSGMMHQEPVVDSESQSFVKEIENSSEAIVCGFTSVENVVSGVENDETIN